MALSFQSKYKHIPLDYINPDWLFSVYGAFTPTVLSAGCGSPISFSLSFLSQKNKAHPVYPIAKQSASKKLHKIQIIIPHKLTHINHFHKIQPSKFKIIPTPSVIPSERSNTW